MDQTHDEAAGVGAIDHRVRVGIEVVVRVGVVTRLHELLHAGVFSLVDFGRWFAPVAGFAGPVDARKCV